MSLKEKCEAIPRLKVPSNPMCTSQMRAGVPVSSTLLEYFLLLLS